MSLESWQPYYVGKVLRPRPLHTVEGLGDRLRLVAFAEKQAARAFREATERFPEASAELCKAWLWVAAEEEKHEHWLLGRLHELGQEVGAVAVALDLYASFERCQSAHEFAHYMARAEERGRVAGERFAQVLASYDEKSARIFAQIALEESQHVAMVAHFFPKI